MLRLGELGIWARAGLLRQCSLVAAGRETERHGKRRRHQDLAPKPTRAGIRSGLAPSARGNVNGIIEASIFRTDNEAEAPTFQ